MTKTETATRVVVVVNGGVVQQVYASQPSCVDVFVIDYDREKADRVYAERPVRERDWITKMVERHVG